MPKSESELKPGEFGEFSWRGERGCYGTVFLVRDRNVFVDIRLDKLKEARMAAAQRLYAAQNELARAFEEFKQREALRRPDSASEILRLEIDMIGLYNRSDPELGEVYFRPDTGDDMWFCSLRNGAFSDLAEEQ